jgi:hypothetical protein
MPIPSSRPDRELNKFTENADGNLAVRVVQTNPSPADAPGPTDLTLSSNDVTEDTSIGGLVAYDVFVYFKYDSATISVVMWLWSQGNPVWQFLFGFLMGHWFAPPYYRGDIK